jgi:hypothetical protein
MLPVTVPNRPFATEMLTGTMLPDGFFEASLGRQRLNAHFRHTGGAALTHAQINVESVSHPAILVTPHTYFMPRLEGGGARLLNWDIDVHNAPTGTHHVSFVVESAGERSRFIKKIFVTRVQFDPATNTFSVQAPEGTLECVFKAALGPKNPPCCGHRAPNPDAKRFNFVNDLSQLVAQMPPKSEWEVCPPIYLITEMDLAVRHNPPFPGQYSDLPFQDPWWKDLLIVLLIIFLIALIVTIIVAGVVSIVITGGAAGPVIVVTFECCAAPVALLLLAELVGAFGSGTLAGLTDARDPFRRGQDNTTPASGELTVSEQLHVVLGYPEPVVLGRPYAVHAKWEYTRLTDAGTRYNYSVSETNRNVHVLNRYEVEAPDVIHSYRREPFVVKGRFFDADDKQMKADQLFVRCILQGTGPLEGQYLEIPMQDDGIDPDEKPADGTYTGRYYFTPKERGIWLVLVFAQDVNTAQPDMAPEDAAKIIGGQVLTHHLTVDFSGGTCPFVPDGHVNVI